MGNKKNGSPWAWIPSLYLAQGLPYVAVQLVSVIMYKRMGMSNTDIALYTSLLYLPWIIKPLWSPFVDLLKTKRWWIVAMQLLLGAGFAGIAFTIPLPFYFQATMAFFYLLAFSSATHDIAADGFYMFALDTNQQAMYVGIRSTFYRIATLMGQGALVILAGFLETHTGAEPLKIQIEASPKYTQETLFIPETINITEQAGDVKFIANQDIIYLATGTINKAVLETHIDRAKALNIENGFILDEKKVEKKAEKKAEAEAKAEAKVEQDSWIKKYFGEKRKQSGKSDEAGNIGVLAIYLSKKPDKEMVLNTSLKNGDKSISLILGERLIFNENNWNKPAFLIFQADSKLTASTKAEFRGLSGNIPFAWSITFFIMAGLFLVFSFYHKFILPKPVSDKPHDHLTAKSMLAEFFATFRTFFQKPQVLAAIFFMLTFRFAEAQLLKLINPFLLDPKDIGGLGLTTGQVGLYYGTFGMISITLGGILGGIVASRGGLKRWLWPMAFSMILTAGTFVYLGLTQNDSFWAVNICIFIEQFGYGFGFTAYMLYMMYFSQGENKTAHYAICTGFMALGMTLPGMFAGWMQEQLGYSHFFIWVMICSIIPITAVSLLKINPAFGKKDTKQ
jgi:PAT family beta-lactamase induction signal transducer AmpG